jgi:Lecithin:cholesterol acyltransferase
MESRSEENQYSLEALEPRVLLSAAPILAGASAGLSSLPSSSQAPATDEILMGNELESEAGGSLAAYDPAAQIEDIFQQISEPVILGPPPTASDLTAVSDEGLAQAQDPTAIAAETATQVDSSDQSNSTRSDPSDSSEPTLSGAEAATEVPAAGSMTDRLTETLRSANGPPAEDGQAQTIGISDSLTEGTGTGGNGGSDDCSPTDSSYYIPERPLLILPGIGGTFAAPGSESDWYVQRGIDPEKLQVDPIAGVYNDLINTLCNVGYVRDKTFFVANYDWRVAPGPIPADLSDDTQFDGFIAGLTSSQIESDLGAGLFTTGVHYLVYWMEKAVQTWTETFGSAPTSVDVIAHSTGGLVARTYIQSAAYMEPFRSITLPAVNNFIMAGVPNRGASKAWNVLNDNWGIDASFRLALSKIINNAYNRLLGGETITGPDYDISPGSPPSMVDFIEKYVPTGRGLLATYDFLNSIGSPAGVYTDVNDTPEDRNWLVLDLNSGLDLKFEVEDIDGLGNDPNVFVDELSGQLHVLYSRDQETPTQDLEFQGLTLKTIPLIVNFDEYLGHLPSSSEIWYKDQMQKNGGDGTVPLVSSLAQFEVDPRWGDQILAQDISDADHLGLMSAKESQKAMLEDLGVTFEDKDLSESGFIDKVLRLPTMIKELIRLGIIPTGDLSSLNSATEAREGTRVFRIPEWQELGPGPILGGQTVGLDNNPVAGAISSIAVHADGTTVYVGTVNGGIWKTDDFFVDSPVWQPLTDDFPSLSISTLTFGSIDSNTLYAGTGSFSSSGNGGAAVGLLKYEEHQEYDGSEWKTIGEWKLLNETFDGKRITQIVAFPNSDGTDDALLVATIDNGALYFSDNGGASFDEEFINEDPDNITDLALVSSFGSGGNDYLLAGIANEGVWRSDDGGDTWSAAVNGMSQTDITDAIRIQFASHPTQAGIVYAALISSTGDLSRLYRSGDYGGTWIAMDLPQTNEAGGPWYLTPGHQGYLHFSMAADPESPYIVYVGGDRQPVIGKGVNEVDLTTWTGRIFQGTYDSDQDNGTTDWVQVVGSNANSTAPHADSRDLTFAWNPVLLSYSLLEADDGGIYSLEFASDAPNRTWVSKNGALRITEIVSLAYDWTSGRVFSGQQDNGTSYFPGQDSNGDGSVDDEGERYTWSSFLKGDGNTQAVTIIEDTDGDGDVDAADGSPRVIWYTMGNNLNSFYRVEFDSAGKSSYEVVKLADPKTPEVKLSGLNASDSSATGYSIIPYVVNAVDPRTALDRTARTLCQHESGRHHH